MKTLIFGATGMLGHDLKAVLKEYHEEFKAPTIEELDITIISDVKKLILEYKPDVVINLAAMTNTSLCEDKPDEAMKINALVVEPMVEACNEIDCKFVYVSTDYVFDGTKGQAYVENDKINPINKYGESKAAGEAIAEQARKHFIIRTATLFGLGSKRNFVETILEQAAGHETHQTEMTDDGIVIEKEMKELFVVAPIVMSPTFAYDLALHMHRLVQTEHYGIYHMSNAGQCSFMQFAQKILEYANVRGIRLTGVDAGHFDVDKKVSRPLYSVLDNDNLKRIGLDTFLDWKTALARYMDKRRLIGGN